MYKRVWTPQVGELHETVCEEDNEHDKYTVVVHLGNSATTIGHIPREITRTCHFFIKSKGEMTGEVSRRRRCCTAPCEGVEVPCLLTFYHRDTRVVEKAKELVGASVSEPPSSDVNGTFFYIYTRLKKHSKCKRM